jgi:hypothetical protein
MKRYLLTMLIFLYIYIHVYYVCYLHFLFVYFDLFQAVQDLYMKKNHVVFDGQDKYNNIISNISAEKCAYECINAPDLSCNSFVYSTSLHVCALSSHVASKNVHFKTTSFYDFYQYSGRKF